MFKGFIWIFTKTVMWDPKQISSLDAVIPLTLYVLIPPFYPSLTPSLLFLQPHSLSSSFPSAEQYEVVKLYDITWTFSLHKTGGQKISSLVLELLGRAVCFWEGSSNCKYLESNRIRWGRYHCSVRTRAVCVGNDVSVGVCASVYWNSLSGENLVIWEHNALKASGRRSCVRVAVCEKLFLCFELPPGKFDCAQACCCLAENKHQLVVYHDSVCHMGCFSNATDV